MNLIYIGMKEVIPLEMNTADRAANQTTNQTNNQRANQAANQTPNSAATSTLSSNLVLISSIINSLNIATEKQDSLFVLAATIGLIATYLTRISAIQEANEQQIAPGVTTFANNLKLISSNLALLAAAIAYWALLIEVSLRAQGISAPQTPGFAASPTVTGAVSVQ